MRNGLLFLVGWAGITGATLALGRPLQNRVGVGLTLHDFNSLPALSLRYVPLNHLTVGFLAGFDTGASGFTILGAKVQRNVDLQENLNAYFGLGLYYLAKSTAGVSSNGYESDIVLGVEAFLPGLSDLGLTFETGLAYRSLAGTSLKTLGSGFLGTAIHYYF